MFTQRKEPKKTKDIQHEKAVEQELANLDLDTAPRCVECDEHYSPRRRALGYDTCLECGSPAKSFAVVPVPKSNYVVATNIDQVRSPYSHKGNR